MCSVHLVYCVHLTYTINSEQWWGKKVPLQSQAGYHTPAILHWGDWGRRITKPRSHGETLSFQKATAKYMQYKVWKAVALTRSAEATLSQGHIHEPNRSKVSLILQWQLRCIGVFRSCEWIRLHSLGPRRTSFIPYVTVKLMPLSLPSFWEVLVTQYKAGPQRVHNEHGFASSFHPWFQTLLVHTLGKKDDNLLKLRKE